VSGGHGRGYWSVGVILACWHVILPRFGAREGLESGPESARPSVAAWWPATCRGTWWRGSCRAGQAR
jgi:hypothetical protein